MKKILFVVALVLSSNLYAGGYTPWAVPTTLEYVNDGVLVMGSFGNPNDCPMSDMIFISRQTVGDVKFQSMLSMLLTALTAQKEVRFRSDYCYNVSFHGQNVSESRTALYIR